jgi:HK97 family phage major capsid protein
MTTDLDAAPVAGLLVAGEQPAPGGWRSALYRADAPGAVLDGQPWARSWPAFMRAVTDAHDSSARTFISNAMNERLPGDGGFLVPEYLRSQVLSYMTGAIVRPEAMVLPMSTLRLPIPTLDNLTQGNNAQALGGLTFAWTAEGAGITPTAPSFGRAVLEARKAAAYLEGVPNEFVDDAAEAFGEFTGRVVSQGYTWFEDDSFISGTGTGEPQGLINAPCAVGITRANSDAVGLVDIAGMVNALHPAALQAALTPGVTRVKWLISADVLGQLLEIYLNFGSATSGIAAPPDWLQLGDGDKVGPSILGIPAVITDHQPAIGTTGDVILADLGQYVIGDRLAMTVERSAKGTGFVTGTSNFRIKARLDGRYWVQSATTTEAGQSVSPVVVLDVAA